jgi:O-antigen/teichoic acid export membrane protein
MFKKLLNSKFKKDLIFSYSTQFLTIIFGFIQLFLINRYFGVKIYGQLLLIMSIVGIFSSLLTARTSEAITKFFKREELNNNYENAVFVLIIGLLIDFITASILLLITYNLADFIAIKFLKNEHLSLMIVFYSFIIFFVFLRGTFIGYFQAKEMFIQINIITIMESFLKVLGLLLVIEFFKDFSLKNIIYVYLGATIGSFFYTIFIFTRSINKFFKSIQIKFNKFLFKEYWSFNIKTFFSSSLKAGNRNIDNLLIGFFLSDEVVGIYQTLKKIISPIMIVSTPFSMLIYPKLVYYFELGERKKFIMLIMKISFYILLIGILYSIISYLFLPLIFQLMNINFFGIYRIYYLLLIILTILVSQMWWVRIFSNVVNPSYSIYMNLFSMLYQLSISYLSVKMFGFIGLIISLIIMNIIIFIFWIKEGREYYANK